MRSTPWTYPIFQISNGSSFSKTGYHTKFFQLMVDKKTCKCTRRTHCTILEIKQYKLILDFGSSKSVNDSFPEKLCIASVTCKLYYNDRKWYLKCHYCHYWLIQKHIRPISLDVFRQNYQLRGIVNNTKYYFRCCWLSELLVGRQFRPSVS